MVANIPFTFRRVWLIVIMYYNLIYDVKYDLILRFGEVFAWLDGEKPERISWAHSCGQALAYVRKIMFNDP